MSMMPISSRRSAQQTYRASARSTSGRSPCVPIHRPPARNAPIAASTHRPSMTVLPSPSRPYATRKPASGNRATAAATASELAVCSVDGMPDSKCLPGERTMPTHRRIAFNGTPAHVGESELITIAFISSVIPVTSIFQPFSNSVSHEAHSNSHASYGTVQLASHSTETCPRVVSSSASCGTHSVASDRPKPHALNSPAGGSVALLLSLSALESFSAACRAHCESAALYASIS